MRASERLAVVTVVLMVAPAFLVFPALGIWLVVRVWPDLTIVQQACFWLSLAMLGLTVPYVIRRHLDAFWFGRTRKLSRIEEALLLLPLALGAWSLTGDWAAAIAVLSPKFIFSLAHILDARTSRIELVNTTSLVEPEDVEPSPVARLVRWITSRPRASRARRAITMETRPPRSRRKRGR